MERKAIRCELVKFPTRDGLLLEGLLARSGKGNRKAIINVFGMEGNFFSSRRYETLYEESKGSGFDLLLANNRGMGSTNIIHSVKGKGRPIGTAKERFEDCLYDIGAAVKFLKRMHYRTIVLQGHSTGCQKCTYYCSRVRDSSVKGLVLLSPCDDYNIARRRDLARRLGSAVRTAEGMVRKGHGNDMAPNWISPYSARRFLSYADPKKAEARLFNYESSMREFHGIKIPILAVFGSKEGNAVMPVKRYLEILESRTSSRNFDGLIISGADHGFHSRERKLAQEVISWARHNVR